MLMLIEWDLYPSEYGLDLNTSHVNVNPKGEEKVARLRLFKYISC